MQDYDLLTRILKLLLQLTFLARLAAIL